MEKMDFQFINFSPLEFVFWGNEDKNPKDKSGWSYTHLERWTFRTLNTSYEREVFYSAIKITYYMPSTLVMLTSICRTVDLNGIVMINWAYFITRQDVTFSSE